MSMSTHVVGFKPPDAKWQQMKAVYDACEAASLKVPEEVMKFFGHEPPDERGVEVEQRKLPVTEWQDGYGRAGFELDVAKLDPDVKIVRFYNSW